ncbi:hypothetical protein [Mycoplasmopsis fermentans]|uniref:ExiS n=1 Tax=Mycoplasmopsis fermentans (strain M64) TaxID=943945 RepID=A0AB32XDB6_MYCFM|nr:hypothetical protein [Mycoplasmopsis fermentans]ADN69405.1 putative ExiS [Mycoplasmopsis fermentans JER]ADV35029.1 ExiS [Mycoplasmopsis fermentans M64]VEU60018.1 ExiS [Mycoplasmopsis fermentans]VEU66973.1 ExiS [Mesomycoplasma conjunctivae]
MCKVSDYNVAKQLILFFILQLFSMLKVPTYKDLNINIKKILWTKNYKSFTEFQKAYSGVFCAKLGHYLSKHKANTKTNFLNMYQIIFYQGFINYNREKELLDLLTYKEKSQTY